MRLDRRSRTARALLALSLLLLPVVTSPAPVKAAVAISGLSPATGFVGDIVTLSGTINTSGGQFRVRWDISLGKILASGTVPAGGKAVSASFAVPEGIRGNHGVYLEDVTAGIFSLAASFTVNPRIAVGPANGPVGARVVVTGAGYLNNEADIAVTYDGDAATETFNAGAFGSWNVTIAVPPSAAGVHTISAPGGAGSNPLAVDFTVTPSISLSTYSGSAGASVAASGAGFRSGETGIAVTWDAATILASGIKAGTNGSWGPVTVTVPAGVAAGIHQVDAYGDATLAGQVPDRTFQIALPVMMVSPTSGPVGQEVKVNGSDFRPGETGIVVTYAGSAVKSGIAADSSGGWSVSFVVPESPTGANQIVDAYGSLTAAAGVPDVEFSVTPGITISPSAGAVGTTVTVNGTGFGAGEKGIAILYDGSVVGSGIVAGSLGSWSSTFTVPAAAAGGHSVDAYGDSTAATAVPDVAFGQNASIAVSPDSGTSGSALTVVGAGFDANEGGITIICAGASIKSGISADDKGAWTASFSLPATAGGSYAIDAYGSSTPGAAVPDVAFTVRPRLSLSLTSGPVGSKVTVTGVSYAANESDISVTYDGAAIVSITAASASGDWTSAFSVPPSAAGKRKVGARSTAGFAGEVYFEVVPEVAQSPSSGNVGASVAVNGTGFSADKPVSITYDGAAVDSGPAPVTTSPAGSFAATLTIPESKAGEHKIGVSDGDGNSRELTWMMESTPPPAPPLLSPKPRTRISMFGNVPVTFDWSDVTDPSGVSYSLQVARSADFGGASISEQGLTSSVFATGKLARGTYYWRVMAVDGASNRSVWSGPSSLKVGLMPLWSFILAIVAGLIVIPFSLLVLRSRLRRPRPPRMPVFMPGPGHPPSPGAGATGPPRR